MKNQEAECPAGRPVKIYDEAKKEFTNFFKKLSGFETGDQVTNKRISV